MTIEKLEKLNKMKSDLLVYETNINYVERVIADHDQVRIVLSNSKNGEGYEISRDTIYHHNIEQLKQAIKSVMVIDLEELKKKYNELQKEFINQ